MRYAQMRSMDTSNGQGIGIALFVQGCKSHCPECFNKETWDFNGGHEWTKEIEDQFIKLAEKPYTTRLSILGGEPMEYPYELWQLVNKVKKTRPDIKVWVYSGYEYETILNSRERMKFLTSVDVLVDGRYIHELRDLNLKWRGSSNQRVIDVKKTLNTGEITLYCD